MRLIQAMAGAAHGGAETFFVDLARAFARAGDTQALAVRPALDRTAALQDVGPVTELPFGGPLDIYSPWKLKSLAREFKPDVVMGWMNRASRVLPRGAWVNVGRLGGYYDLKYYRRCHHLICNTPDIRDYVVREGWPVARAHYVPNYCPVEKVPAIPREMVDTPAGAKVLLILARLQPVKGIDVAIRALADVPDAYLWIAGEGPLEGDLKKLTAECGVASRVKFLGWRDDRAALLATADVCLVPSRFEPFGNVVVNAWAHGVPLVAAASQGPGFLVRDGADGLKVPVDDAPALAAAINAVLKDDALAKKLAAGGLARAAGEFSEAAVVDGYRAVFTAALG